MQIVKRENRSPIKTAQTLYDTCTFLFVIFWYSTIHINDSVLLRFIECLSVKCIFKVLIQVLIACLQNY
jgi:uncharacterized PurR-regulated membrane protein YhhQ (DUF165 family)